MTDVSIIPDENIVNENGISIGDRARLIESSQGYSPTPDDSIIVKLTRDDSQIAIGQILINAYNFVSATLLIKTETERTWTQFATLIRNRTTFDNLVATELQFQFTRNPKYVKLGIIGCFPPTGKRKVFVTDDWTETRWISSLDKYSNNSTIIRKHQIHHRWIYPNNARLCFQSMESMVELLSWMRIGWFSISNTYTC